MDLKKSKNSSPRIKVIQKLYNSLMNPEAEIDYPKSQFKKYIKDVIIPISRLRNESEELVISAIYMNSMDFFDISI